MNSIMERFSRNIAYICAWMQTAIGGWTLNDIAIISGIVLGVATFVVNWYYQAKKDRREEQRYGEPE